MAHPLFGAELRFRRTERHLTEAEALIVQWSRDVENNAVSNDNFKTINFGKWPPVPENLAVVISDVIHNFRSAMDYIVYELALLDSGKPQDGTQFLIEDVKVDALNPKRGFDPRSKIYLKGLNPRHIDMIESFQPYKGVTWTKTLRDISNPDKHRKLIDMTHEGRRARVRVHYRTGGKYRGAEKMTPDGPVYDSYDIEFEGEHAIAIAPGNPSDPPLLETMRTLQTGILSAIEIFKPEFPV